MIKWLLEPQLNLFDVLVYSALLGLYMEDYIGLLLFMVLCVASGAVGAIVQTHFYKESK